MIALRISLYVLLQLSTSDQSRMTVAEARKLVDAVIPTSVQRHPHRLAIELDRDHDGCLVYHAYQRPGKVTFPVGYWSIDTRTAEVWNDLTSERMSNKQLARVQRAIRKRLGVTDHEQSASLSNPCYERGSK